MSKESNHDTVEDKWVVLCETNGQEIESWYYFIKLNGNEKALNYLQRQLEKIDMHIVDDLSTFDLDLEHTFSDITTKEMIKLEINSCSFHRRFDGKLDMINLDLRRKDDNDDKLQKVNDVLGYGRIEDYINDEYIDPEDLTDTDDEKDDDENDELLVPVPDSIKPDELVEKDNDKKKEDDWLPKPTTQIGGGMRRKKKKKRN